MDVLPDVDDLKRFDSPDEVRIFEKGRFEQSSAIGGITHRPRDL